MVPGMPDINWIFCKTKYYDSANFNSAIDKEIHHLSIQYLYKKANFALDVSNLTDEQFEHFYRWPQAGRQIIFSTLIHY